MTCLQPSSVFSTPISHTAKLKLIHYLLIKNSQINNLEKDYIHYIRTTHSLPLEINTLLNPLNAELNSIRHLLALVGARHIVHVSGIRVKGAITAWAASRLFSSFFFPSSCVALEHSAFQGFLFFGFMKLIYRYLVGILG